MRFIRAMHSCLCYHRSACSWTLYIFILCLSAQPFSGLVGEADSPSTKFTPAFCCGCNLLIYLKQRLSQYFGYVLALAFQPCPIWTVSWRLWSVLEGPLVAQCLRRFWKGGPKISAKISHHSCARRLVFPIWSLRGIRSCIHAADGLTARMAAFPPSLACHLVPVFRVSKFIERNTLIL